MAAVAMLVVSATAQQQQVSSLSPTVSSLTRSPPLPKPPSRCTGTPYPNSLPDNCSGSHRGVGYVGHYIDTCGFEYTVYCGSSVAVDPVATYDNVTELSQCMEICDQYAGCTSAMHFGQTCFLDTSATWVTGSGHPGLATLIKGSYKGMKHYAPLITPVREHRRAVAAAAATVSRQPPMTRATSDLSSTNLLCCRSRSLLHRIKFKCVHKATAQRTRMITMPCTRYVRDG